MKKTEKAAAASTKTSGAKLTIQAPAKKSPKKPIEDLLEEMEENGDSEEGGGKIAQILMLWIKGYTRVDIVKAGFNRSTVYRQIGEFEKMKKAPVMSYFGHDMYEARIQRLMKAKKCSRDKAVEVIAQKDMES